MRKKNAQRRNATKQVSEFKPSRGHHKFGFGIKIAIQTVLDRMVEIAIGLNNATSHVNPTIPGPLAGTVSLIDWTGSKYDPHFGYRL